MASKRSASDAGASSSSGPPAKKLMTQFEPIRIGSIFSLEELDLKVLQFQNRKLVDRIEQRRKAEAELRKRIEQLEQRQTMDDAVLCTVNRFWNQLDEDVRVLLQRFDAEGADEDEKENESKAVTSFLALLAQWDKSEMEEKLNQRVEFSKRAIGKLLQAYDRLLQRNEKLILAVKGKADSEAEEELKKKEEELDARKSGAVKEEKVKEEKVSPVKEEQADSKEGENKTDQATVKEEKVDTSIVKEEPMEDGEVPAEKQGVDKEKPAEEKPEVKTEATDEAKAVKSEKPSDEATEVKKEEEKVEKKPKPTLSEVVIDELESMHADNKRLHDLITELHQKHHEVTLRNSELVDKLSAAETEAAELKNLVEDLEYDLEDSKERVDKLDRHLSEALTELKSYDEGTFTAKGGGEGVSKNKFEEICMELEEMKELAANRLMELEKLQKDHQEAVREIEKLKMDLSTLPESVVVETVEYKCLQSQFSVLYNESMQMKTQLEDARAMLQNSKNAHLRQIEQMEGAELHYQKQLRTEVIQLEDQLAQVRREYDMLRIEFEQTLAANEQTGPINREMRNLITSLKNHNEQLKGEVARYKRKLKEAQAEINKLRTEVSQLQIANENAKADKESSNKEKEEAAKTDEPYPSTSKKVEDGAKEDKYEREKLERERAKADADLMKDLRAQLKKSQDNQKEMKLLLDTYKTLPKDSRDKVQLMANEKKLRVEIEDLKNHISKLKENERKERRKLAEDDALRKIKKLEDTISELQKALAAQKQEEEALLNEMEVTGQAFEDMQEQNIRLLQQLREKDDANFKLMSERIKSNQIQKLLREEREVLAEQVATLHAQVDAQNLVVRKLEEKEQILQNNLATVEKELGLRQQGSELHKRKAVESAQTAADLKLHLDKYHAQLKEAQVTVADKASSLQQESYKHRRIQEEVASLRKKVERAKKIEMAKSADEVLMAEIQEYKEQLTCPSCKVKRKDAVLTKCFHVFCLECLKTRYETRQRKCPKCNAAFGAKDYHRLYLT